MSLSSPAAERLTAAGVPPDGHPVGLQGSYTLWHTRASLRLAGDHVGSLACTTRMYETYSARENSSRTTWIFSRPGRRQVTCLVGSHPRGDPTIHLSKNVFRCPRRPFPAPIAGGDLSHAIAFVNCAAQFYAATTGRFAESAVRRHKPCSRAANGVRQDNTRPIAEGSAAVWFFWRLASQPGQLCGPERWLPQGPPGGSWP